LKYHSELAQLVLEYREQNMTEVFMTIDKNLIPSDPRFGCGPSLIPVEFIDNLKKTGMHLLGTSHRRPAVKNLVKEVQEGLRTYFKVPKDFEILLGNGGATFLFDAISLGITEKASAHYTCGEFSNKWYKCAKAVPWLEAKEFAVTAGEGITPAIPAGFDLVACTLNETSTGVQIDKFPDSVPKDVIFCVDATSGGGQVPCDVSKVDLFFFSPQKVFASDGGLFVAIASPKFLERAKKIAIDKSRYVPDIMNWMNVIDNSTKNQTYNTPAITTLFFLNEEIKLLNTLGYDEVIRQAQAKAKVLYDWAEQKPYLSAFIKEAKYRSIAVATIDVDAKVDVAPIIEELEKAKIVYGIDPYRKLGRNQFRIALFHNIKHVDIEKLTKLLSSMIEEKL
jgi:phosphoserine aminotransferase